MEGNKILTVGLSCLDVVHLVGSYPVEDTDQRSLDQYLSLGGNAANSCVVLNNIGEKCDYLGTLAKDTLETQQLLKQFKEKGVDVGNCPFKEGSLCPNSCIIVNKESGSRTIIHTNKNLPELTLEDLMEYFTKVDLRSYRWIHFEGRNLDNVLKMIEYLRKQDAPIKISVEVEKVKQNFEQLIPHGDVVFVSKDVARYHGASNMVEALNIFKGSLRNNAQLICPWGESGASGLDQNGNAFSAPSFSPENGVVDTIGAGDCFNAAVIGALSRGKDLQSALTLGCKVAGAKVGQVGFDGLGVVYLSGITWRKYI